MESSQNQKLKPSRVKNNVRCAAALLAAFSGLSLLAAVAAPQTPAKQDQAASAPEKTPEQSADKQQPVPTKVEMQQKQLAEDTAKLLQLANELKADMDKTTKDTLSLTVVKKAEQVEKLAHKVREEMKASIGN